MSDWIWMQFMSYGPSGLIFFAFASSFPAYKFGVRGLFVGVALITIFIGVSDVWWIQSEMNKPDWSGTPDMDFVFHIGVYARVISINLLLLPLSGMGLLLRRKLRPTDDAGGSDSAISQ
jgi:hypothetical protein